MCFGHLAVLTLILLSSPALAAGLVPDRITQAIQQRIAAGQCPVLVVAVVDGEKSEVVAFGKLPNGKPATADTVFEIGSATKTFTATLLAKAVVNGQVRLDQPVAQLVPRWTIPSRGGKQITLGDIAAQRSGLPRLPANLAPKDAGNPYADYDVEMMKSFLASYTPPRDPDVSYEYSNFGFGLLGTALGEHAGKTYPLLLKDEVLTPLGMTHSSAANATTPELAPGRIETGEPAHNWDFQAIAGAGALRSSGNDMLRYLKANMNPDNPSLGKAMALAQTPRAVVDAGSHIGLAWMITDKNGIVWHNGMTGGYASFVGFTADRKHGVVVLTNAAQSVDDIGFATLSPEMPLATTQKIVVLSDAALDEYAGVYKLSDNFSIRVFRDKQQLYTQGTGQGPILVFPSAKDEFFARAISGSLSFKRDASGKVGGLVLHQNGDREAVRQPDEPTVTIDPAILKDYEGKFQLTPDAVFDVVAKDGKLFVQLTGQPGIEIYPSAKDKFFYKVVDAKIDFERDASGKVVALILRQNGQDMRSPRIGADKLSSPK